MHVKEINKKKNNLIQVALASVREYFLEAAVLVPLSPSFILPRRV